MNVYVVGGATEYAKWLPNVNLTNFEESELVIFTGGADVIPTFYGAVKHPKTHYDGGRDAVEVREFIRAFHNNKKLLGICRGSQFLTVMSGGRLIQHVTNHAITGQHAIESEEFGEGAITSTHHQMMYPYDMPPDNYELLAWSKNRRSDTYQFTGQHHMENFDSFIEPEIVYYPKTKALCIQGHPERMKLESDGIKLCRKIFNKYHG